MKLLKRSPLFLSMLLLLAACTKQGDLVVAYSNPQIAYEGRIDTSNSTAARLFWSGTTIRINFEGEAIAATLADQRGDNYYNVFVDGDSLTILRPDTTQREYLLASDLGAGKHRLEIFKRTEWDRGTTSFYGFRISGKAKLLQRDPAKKRKIEFYGNSITAGYAVDDFSGKDRSDSIFTNNYRSYARLTADHYNAQYSCICKSGIGITVSWFPTIMPEIYDRLDPTDPNSPWDFSRYTPDVVVINLFQNDSWLVNMPQHEQFKARFGSQAPTPEFITGAYANFVRSIRTRYPEAQIVCMLGSMDATREGSPWPGYVEQAVAQLDDPRIFTHFVPFKNTGGHPNIAEQQAMAQSLIGFMDEHIDW
ncbi:SGNH/GDSL hydrolase family protein [Mangrovibacterium marinum]|uniref:GDSL-like lipase/acylhydrolase family protein n=1 Tax=Mangrovibacterium marinum TaxID=1639118 RepID=A0A2T5C111_9BACT|nr:SGNH/GDSL hydrolase family protein [Mangrovibacterium marinum]PTN08299.1 GDSL-like lipase/acylhydrolase family protein [Mangrovibacterium marinum]